MSVSPFVPFIALGAIIGIANGILFFRSDSLWIKSIGLTAGNVGFLYAFFLVVDKLKLSSELHSDALSSYLISLIIFGFSTFFICMRMLMLKQQASPIKISILDILLGRKDIIDTYYKIIQKNAQHAGDAKDIQNIEERLEHLTQKERHLEARQKEIDDLASSNDLHVALPENAIIPVSDILIKSIPDFVERIWNYSKYINQVSNQHADDIENRAHESEMSKGEYSLFDVIRGYFLDICIGTSNHLFDSTDVRVHFRFLNGDQYVKLVSSMGQTEYEDELSPIDCDRGMICKAGQLKKSLIKTLNMDSHQKAQHDHKWENYITLVFDDFFDKGIPFLSMGISIKNVERHRHLLYFINYIKIEQLIQQAIKIVDNKLPILGVLRSNTSETVVMN